MNTHTTDTSLLSAIAQQLGKRGGETTKRKYGSQHFSTAGKRGMAKRWGTRKQTKNKKNPSSL